MRIYGKGLFFLLSSSTFAGAMFVSLSSAQTGDSSVTTGTFLSQGWSSSTREAFHYAPQGSELVPYYWFINLMDPDGTTLFKDNLSQFGVLYDNPSPGIKHHNPDYLPIGFAHQIEDHTYRGITEKHWLGLTCAACHTGAMIPKPGSNSKKQGTIIIDGAPARFDVAAFLTKLQIAVQRTNDDPEKLRTLAEKALSAGDGKTVEEIETRFHNYTRQLNEILPLYLPKIPSGPGRLDCFGAIINRVCVYDIESTQKPPAKLDAPVDFPFIWYTDRQDNIQWFGQLPNSNWLDRLSRNAGEVSGVFAQVRVTPDGFWGYRSSVDIDGLARIDKAVSSLRSPKWSDVFPAPDPGAVRRGKELFQHTCQAGGCHRDLAAEFHVDKVKPTPLKEDPNNNPYHLPNLNTDENNTKLIQTTMSDTGIMKKGPLGRPIVSPMPAAQLVGYVVAGELLGQAGVVLQAYLEYKLDQLFQVDFASATDLQKAKAKKSVQAEISQKVIAQYSMINHAKTGAPKTPIKFDPMKAGYESRSMNGIWATAPYLHNGSVPSLYALLWPKQRPKTFYTGSLVYDPVKMGFVANGSAGGTLFNTALPGNSNKGHTYGAGLSPAKKNDLLAYLKSL